MKRKLLLAALCVVSALGFKANAQKDVTSQYITNATLKDGYNNGWISTGFHAGPTQGNNTVGYTVECWAGNDNNGNPLDARKNFSLTQDITLPAGSYRLVNYSFYRQSWGATDDASKSLAYLKAGDQQTKIVTLGSITGQASYANNMAEAANRFDTKMYRNVVEFTVAADNPVVNIGITGTHDTAGSWFICGMFELFDLNDVATVSSPTDMTYAITNPGFEYGNLTGWTNSITQGNNTYAKNNNFASKYGVGFYESWKSGVALGNAGTFTQTLANMPAGLYELSVYAQNVEQYNGDAGGTGMFLKANNDQTQIGSRNQYKVRTTLQSNGDLTIGINLDNCTGNWIAFDRFELQFYGDPLKAYQDLLDEAVAGARALINGTAGSAISATAKAAWQDVVDDNDNDPKTFTQESQFTAAIENITNANTNYQAMAAPYATWLKVKAGADAMALVSNNNAEATTTLTNAASTQNTAAEAALTATDLNTAISTLRTAIRTFVAAAEPTGGNKFEITCLVENPSFDDNTITGWTRNITKTGGAAQTTFTCNEFWNNTFDFYQDMPDLPNGSYQLSVQAFSRPGGNDAAYPAYVAGTNSVTAELYVNSDASTVGNIYAYTGNTTGAKAGGSFPDYKCVVEGGTDYWVPNGMEGASLYFADENVYKTTVAALVEDGNLRIGFRDETYTKDQWTIFDNFRLYYYGSDKTVYYAQYLPQLKAEVVADKSNALYTNVTGKELSVLNDALGVDASSFTTEQQYSDAIQAIKNAQTAYRAAYPSYDALVAAKAYAALTKITANIGTGVFQYNETTNNTLYSAYETAKGAVDNYTVSEESTAANVQTLVNNLDNAIANYNNQPLNAPANGTKYYIKVATDGHAKVGNAIVIVPGSVTANNPTGYGLNANFAPNANLAQAVTFTKVSGNDYTISFETAEGTAYLTYGVTNGSTADHKNSQIQATTDASKKGEFTIVATATDNVFNIVNKLTGTNIDCQAGGNIYTDETITLDGFSVAEASQASVNIDIAAAVKYATRIFPFTPELPSGVKAYSCGALESNGTTLHLEEVASPQANVPYILEAESGCASTDLTGWGVLGNLEAKTVDYLTGVYTETTAPVGSYVLQNNNDKVAFYLVATGEEPTVGANRAYLTVPAQQGAKERAYFFDGDASAIEAISALTTGEVEAIYTAGGVQVKSLQKGMNIVVLKNGQTQKVYVK